MCESYTNKFSTTKPANGFKPEAKSLLQNILGYKSLWFNILR